MKVAAKLENLHGLLESVREFANKQGIASEQIGQIELAFEEIIVNIINYAYPAGNPGNIEIQLGLVKEKKFTIEIIDWGTPFDPLAVAEPDTDSDVERRQIGGLGIFFVRQIMDEVSYRREGDKNILTLIKYLDKLPV